MRRIQITFLSAGLLFGSLSLLNTAQAANEGTDTVPPPPQIQQAEPDTNAAQPDASTSQSSQSNDGITPTTPARPDTSAPNTPPTYDLTTIIIDYKEYKIGDTVPQQYLDKTYTITEWQKRNLPAPQENTHWAYINANYILITNDVGKIVMGKSGDIFFRG
ncbi:MAG: RcnB family protein [Enterobacterales bacterium endosymbiont of Blomia tropicalis]|uniref:RcnB family protein n=1 Tax=Mixta mediterraneensis TaxID=2758443 RepID=UPI0025A8702F|nr:RcnB family protein [Mixta mediterraneensis]MDL4915462.1 RcnB family protein [Mixta mediterraneensis]